MGKPLLPYWILLATAFSGAAQAADTIDPKSWLTPDAAPFVESAPVQLVFGMAVPESTRLEASGLLASVPIVELTYEQARHPLGMDPNSILGATRGNPFLVRGVSPNSAGRCEADQQGDALSVFCGSLGDFRYEVRPMVVFLREKPRTVQVHAMTAR
jgi:hypothetical protein